VPSEEGLASYYADALHGRKTASGEPYDKAQLTCAHRSFPFGTELTVERLDTGARTTCRVNDRGPSSPKRIVDLSRAAAEQLDLLGPGVTRVRLWITNPATSPQP
jgi:rare lipoprotein A